MSIVLAFVALVAAVNAPRGRFVLGQESPGERVTVGGLGAILAFGGVALTAVAAEPLRDAFGISIETARIGAGVVAALVGARDLVAGLPDPEPSLPGRRAALVPVAFPVLLNPALIFLAFSTALDHTSWAAVLLALPALATLPLAAIVEIGGAARATRRAMVGAARLTAALLVLAGIAVAVDGVFDI